MYFVTIKDKVSLGHYLRGIKGADASQHGHSYNVSVVFKSRDVDGLQMVAHPRDLKRAVTSAVGRLDFRNLNDFEPFNEAVNPTPEMIAQYLYEVLTVIMEKKEGIDVEKVEIESGDVWGYDRKN